MKCITVFLFIILVFVNCSPYYHHFFKGKVIDKSTKLGLKNVKIDYYLIPVDYNDTVYTNNNGDFEFERGLGSGHYNQIKIIISKINYTSKEIISNSSEWELNNGSDLLDSNYEYDFGNIELEPTSDVVK